jgi:quercetin dioxygenase-like cupin family protein
MGGPVKISRASDTPTQPLDTEYFTGPGWRRDLARLETPAGSALVVHFEAGTRNHWHRHRGGQVLYVLEGTGWVATRGDGEVRIGQGDLVYAPPDEEHWHGASETEPMTHLALSFGETDWPEPVPERA